MPVDPATARAVAALTRGKAQASALGGKPKKGGPSILSRVFDVISRPLYATAEPVARAVEGRNPGDILKGIAGGLAGKNKTDYGSVIERGAEAGVGPLKAINKNKFAKAAIGLGADILLDPTTYIGAGLIKGAAKEAAETAGAKIGRAAVDNADNVQRILNKADAAKQARLTRGPVEVADKATKGGRRLQTPEEVAKKAEAKFQNTVRAEQRAATRQADKIGKEETQRILSENKGKVQLKFAGKKITQSEKLYKGGQTVKNALAGTEAGKWFGQAFSTGSQFAGKTNLFKRVAELRGIANAENDIKVMREFFKPLAKDDRALISHTIEKGSDAVAKLETARPELAPFLQEAQRAFKYMGAEEVNKGVFRAAGGKSADDFLMDNYVYHWYEGGTDAQRKAFKADRRKAVGPETPGHTQKRTFHTLEDAKAANLKPLENIDDILARRMGKHHQALARSHYVDSVVKEYGVSVGSKSARQMQKEGMGLRGVDSPYVPKGTVFPEHIAKSIETLEKMHTNDEFYNKFLKVFDAGQSYWKFGATSLNPGHHIRNMIGDGFNNFLDGVDNPLRYAQAAQAMKADSGFKLTLRTKGGRKTIDRATLERLMVDNGAKSGFVGAELLQGAPSNMARGVMGKANQIAGKREEYMRTAHFIDALVKESKTTGSLAEAAEKAGARVRKWNLDYGDVTDWERSVMKRAIPFYTWSRKNLPLQIEAMAMRPGRISTIPKGTAAIERLLGTDTGYNQGDLASIPKWLKEMAPIQLRGEGEGKNSIYWVPALPFQDIAKYTEGGEQGIFQSIVSQLTPAARIPFEKATGVQTFSGNKVPGNVEYAAGQNPLLRLLYNNVTGKQTGAKNINWLTGLGLQEVTEGQKQGELKRQQQGISKQVRELRKKATGQ